MLELPKQKFDEVINREFEEVLGVYSKDTFTQDEVVKLLSEYRKVLKN